MKILVYSVCWNESMFLPFYLRHYSSFAKKIIVYDQHSDDGSRELLQKNKLVEIRDYDAVGIHEPSVTALYNTCYHEARGKADWVILCDIDEIVYDPYIITKLQEYKDMGMTVAKMVGYTMLHKFPPIDYSKQVWKTYKYGVRDEVFDKLNVFNPKMDVEYAPGRHTAKFTPEPIYSQPEIKLLHYRYWGMDWVLKRHEIHYARLSKENIENSWGYNKFPERNDGSYYTPKWFGVSYQQREEVV